MANTLAALYLHFLGCRVAQSAFSHLSLLPGFAANATWGGNSCNVLELGHGVGAPGQGGPVPSHRAAGISVLMGLLVKSDTNLPITAPGPASHPFFVQALKVLSAKDFGLTSESSCIVV